MPIGVVELWVRLLLAVIVAFASGSELVLQRPDVLPEPVFTVVAVEQADGTTPVVGSRERYRTRVMIPEHLVDLGLAFFSSHGWVLVGFGDRGLEVYPFPHCLYLLLKTVGEGIPPPPPFPSGGTVVR